MCRCTHVHKHPDVHLLVNETMYSYTDIVIHTETYNWACMPMSIFTCTQTCTSFIPICITIHEDTNVLKKHTHAIIIGMHTMCAQHSSYIHMRSYANKYSFILKLSDRFGHKAMFTHTHKWKNSHIFSHPCTSAQELITLSTYTCKDTHTHTNVCMACIYIHLNCSMIYVPE